MLEAVTILQRRTMLDHLLAGADPRGKSVGSGILVRGDG
jgi:hypothetical protein